MATASENIKIIRKAIYMITPEQKMNPPPGQEALSSARWKATGSENIRQIRIFKTTKHNQFPYSIFQFGGIITVSLTNVKQILSRL